MQRNNARNSTVNNCSPLAFVHCSGGSAVKIVHASVKYSVPIKISLHQN